MTKAESFEDKLNLAKLHQAEWQRRDRYFWIESAAIFGVCAIVSFFPYSDVFGSQGNIPLNEFVFMCAGSLLALLGTVFTYALARRVELTNFQQRRILADLDDHKGMEVKRDFLTDFNLICVTPHVIFLPLIALNAAIAISILLQNSANNVPLQDNTTAIAAVVVCCAMALVVIVFAFVARAGSKAREEAFRESLSEVNSESSSQVESAKSSHDDPPKTPLSDEEPNDGRRI